MAQFCRNCGSMLPDNATVCNNCNAPVANIHSSNLRFVNPFSVAALILSVVLCALCVFTAFVDSSTFINRLYTTALAWSLPLVAVGSIIGGFVFSSKCGGSSVLSWVATLFMVVAFGFSNITKNTVQDVISNADNFVDVATETIDDKAGDIKGWSEQIENAVESAKKKLRNDMYESYNSGYNSDYDRYNSGGYRSRY